MEVLEIVLANNYVGFEELFVIWRCCKALRPCFVGVSIEFDSLAQTQMLRLPSLEFCEKVERALQFKERCTNIDDSFEQLVLLLASEDYTEEVLYMLRNANCHAYFLAKVARMHGGLVFAGQLLDLTTDHSGFHLVYASGSTISFVRSEFYWTKNYWNWLTEREENWPSGAWRSLSTDRLWRFFVRCIAERCQVSLAYLGTNLIMNVHFSAEQYKYVTTTYFDFLAYCCAKIPMEFAELCEKAAQWRYPRALELLTQIGVKNGTVVVWTYNLH